MKKYIIIIIVVALILTVGGCARTQGGSAASYTTTIMHGDDFYPLHADSSLVPSINPNAPEVCGSVPSQVSGRRDFCRVALGLNAPAGRPQGDDRNWKIAFTFGNSPGGSPPVSQSDGNYGTIITLEDGATYEGCYWTSPDDAWRCSYRTTNQFVAGGGCGGICFFLGKLWDWTHYELTSDIGCAGGAAAALAGRKGITLTFLSDCSDQPYK